MIASLTQLLNHYANRIQITMQAHEQGAQLTICVMPCPHKVNDDDLRGRLIQPIVIAGDAQALSEQLRGIEMALSKAQANDAINQSVNKYLASLEQTVSQGGDVNSHTKRSNTVNRELPKQDSAVSTPALSTNAEISALDNMFI